MTSATTTAPRGTGRHRAEGRGYGLVFFAAILLRMVGCFNMIYGIAAIANSHVFVANAHYVVANLRTWGWITLIIAVLQLAAAVGVLADNQLARWFAVDVVALYGLCAPTAAAQTWPPSRKCPPQLRTSFIKLGPSCPGGARVLRILHLTLEAVPG